MCVHCYPAQRRGAGKIVEIAAMCTDWVRCLEEMQGNTVLPAVQPMMATHLSTAGAAHVRERMMYVSFDNPVTGVLHNTYINICKFN